MWAGGWEWCHSHTSSVVHADADADADDSLDYRFTPSLQPCDLIQVRYIFNL